MEIVQQLKALRLDAGMTEDQMGEFIGYSGRVVTAIEAGNRPIGLKTLIKWSEAVKKELSVSFQ
nr:helix-turn-helix transcriptional regulator [uncultured Dyadobacter sp.]